MKEVICLDCSTVILIEDDIYIGLNVTCPKCEAEFEVTHLAPVQLEWAFDDDYDYYYDDDDDDDDLYGDEVDEEVDEEIEEYG
jgi:hypothetical protein